MDFSFDREVTTQTNHLKKSYTDDSVVHNFAKQRINFNFFAKR